MNAKEEFIRKTLELNIKCAYIEREYCNDLITHVLKVDYTQQEYEDFLNSLDFEYDSGYGLQELYGFIWIDDGSWLERGEYDGSEWWSYKTCPNLPKEVLR